MVLKFRSLFSAFPGFSTSAGVPRIAVAAALGALVLGGTGTLIVRAAENPMLRETMREFSRPLRQSAEHYLPRAIAPPVQYYAPVQARYTQPYPALRFEPLPRLTPAPQPRSAAPVPRDVAPSARKLSLEQPAPRARQRLMTARSGPMAQGPTNYCVRLCDGFAFPIGDAGRGGERAQEAACNQLCPGAQTALFSAPAGAKDLDQLARGNQLYSALPAAFSYRQAITPACSCRAIGATQSSAALLTDMTLRPGDIMMTRIGFRHFDGARQFPYRASHFSDAMTKLKDKREVAIVRAMETASVRGILSVNAPQHVRDRVVAESRRAELVALQTSNAADGAKRGFVELNPRESARQVTLPVVRRAPGLVALN